MAFTSTTKEDAFRQDIEAITEHEDLEFAKRHFLFVHRHSCREAPQPQQCIDDGRNTYVQFAHHLKLAKQRAFSCMGGCSEAACYAACLGTLQERVTALYSPLQPTLDEYLMKFAPQ